MKKVGLNTMLWFGKYKGKTVKHVIEKENNFSYINWCIQNVKNFETTKGVRNLIDVYEEAYYENKYGEYGIWDGIEF